MHQNAFGGRALPGPAGGAYSAPPDPLAGFKGPTSKGTGGEGNGGEDKGGQGRGPEGRGEGREGEKGSEGIGERGWRGRRMGIAHPLFSA